MPEATSFSKNPVVYFLSKSLILLGMVLVFLSISSFAFTLIIQAIWDINIEQLTAIISNPNSVPNGILVLKLFQVFVSIGSFAIPAFMFSKAIGQNPFTFLNINKNGSLINYVFILLIMLASMPIISWLYSLNQQMSFPLQFADWEQKIREWENAASQQMQLFISADSISVLLFNLFIFAVVPAITEEIFFRGCLQNFIRFSFKNIHASVIVSAFIFSAVHGQFYGFIPRFALGLALGYSFAFSGSIWVCIAGHFLNNAVALISSYILSKNSNFDFLKDDFAFPFYINLLSVLLCVGMLYWMYKQNLKTILLTNNCKTDE